MRLRAPKIGICRFFSEACSGGLVQPLPEVFRERQPLSSGPAKGSPKDAKKAQKPSELSSGSTNPQLLGMPFWPKRGGRSLQETMRALFLTQAGELRLSAPWRRSKSGKAPSSSALGGKEWLPSPTAYASNSPGLEIFPESSASTHPKRRCSVGGVGLGATGWYKQLPRGRRRHGTSSKSSEL